MKITEQEIERAGNRKKRVLFALGFEEIEILHAILVKSMGSFPELTDPSTYGRMKNMAKAMSIYLGRSKPRPEKSSDFPCPICKRKLRGEKAVESHLRDVHKKENE